MHLLACHHDCWGLRVAFDLIPSMKSYHPVALAHEAENKQSGVGLVGLHWSDSSPAALTADSRTRLVLCTDSLSRDVYDVKCPFPWSNCLVLDMIQQKKPVACCILPGGGCLTLLQHPGSGVWLSRHAGLDSSNRWVFKSISPSVPLNTRIWASGLAQFLAAQMLMACCVSMSDCAQHRCFCSIALNFPREPGHLLPAVHRLSVLLDQMLKLKVSRSCVF